MKKFDSVQESVSDHCLNYLISGKIDDIGVGDSIVKHWNDEINNWKG